MRDQITLTGNKRQDVIRYAAEYAAACMNMPDVTVEEATARAVAKANELASIYSDLTGDTSINQDDRPPARYWVYDCMHCPNHHYSTTHPVEADIPCYGVSTRQAVEIARRIECAKKYPDRIWFFAEISMAWMTNKPAHASVPTDRLGRPDLDAIDDILERLANMPGAHEITEG